MVNHDLAKTESENIRIRRTNLEGYIIKKNERKTQI